MANQERDWIPLFPSMVDLLKRSKGDEHMYIMESMFDYSAGDYQSSDRLKKKCRRTLWKAIDEYRFEIDQCLEEIEDDA